MSDKHVQMFLLFWLLSLFNFVAASTTPNFLLSPTWLFCPDNAKYNSCFHLAQNSFAECEVWDFYCQCEQLNVISNICSRYCLNIFDNNDEIRSQIKVFCGSDIIKPHMPVFSPDVATESLMSSTTLKDRINNGLINKPKVFQLIPFSDNSSNLLDFNYSAEVVQATEELVGISDYVYIKDLKPYLFKLEETDQSISQVFDNTNNYNQNISNSSTIQSLVVEGYLLVNITDITESGETLSSSNSSVFGILKTSTTLSLDTNSTVFNSSFILTDNILSINNATDSTNFNNQTNSAEGFNTLNSTADNHISEASRFSEPKTKLLLVVVTLSWFFKTL